MSKYRLVFILTGEVVNFTSEKHRGLKGRNSLQAYFDRRHGVGRVIVTYLGEVEMQDEKPYTSPKKKVEDKKPTTTQKTRRFWVYDQVGRRFKRPFHSLEEAQKWVGERDYTIHSE